MEAPYKLLWLYILDECDHAGVWIVDFEVAKLRLNEEVNEQDALKFFESKIFQIDDGDRWLILDFIDFQYGTILNEKNKVHQAVIEILKKYDLWCSEENTIYRNKELTSPMQGAKDKEKEKDEDKDKEKDENSFKKESMVIYPFNTETFKAHWKIWKEYRVTIEKPFKGEISEQAALKQLSGMARDEPTAIKIIEQSLANGWQGLFEIKDNNNGKQAGKNGKSGSDRLNEFSKYFASKDPNNTSQ